ncbi:aminoglycoside N(3)-acetyltransferase [Kitasatospora sp. NPDC059571]|uniref:aminoglycoside N(3)-acetyltransferase n=1 Tax=Kitasatospora sp. NPDC059571 TaxID=3346871 RepID=UPI00368334C0
MSATQTGRSVLQELGEGPVVAPVDRPADSPARPPWTAGELAAQLADLRIGRGDTVLVQSSLRRLGRLQDGAGTLLTALLTAVGAEGTIVAYTACPENSDTSRLARRLTEGMTLEEETAHKAAMPAYDPETTPTSPVMGHFSELVRKEPGARRSAHPQASFAAVGARAEELMREHRLESHLGPGSPVEKLYRDPSARALLIGLPVWCCTAFHYAEYQLPNPPRQVYGCVVDDGSGPHWEHFNAVRLVDAYFVPMGPVLEDALDRTPAGLGRGRLGDADCFVVPIRNGIDACREYLQTQAG